MKLKYLKIQHLKKKSGVYSISNIINDFVYIGGSKNIRKRLHYHLLDLINNKHHSYKLQDFFNKYGMSVLNFNLIQESSGKENILILEQYYLDLNKENLFNISTNAKSRKGVKTRDCSIIKMIKSNTGKKRSKEYCKKVSERLLKFHPLTGTHISDEHKKKISKPIYQYSSSGDFIKRFDSIKQASEELNILHTSISNNIKNGKGYCTKQKYSFKYAVS